MILLNLLLIIAGQPLPASPVHKFYTVIELLKFLLLLGLAWSLMVFYVPLFVGNWVGRLKQRKPTIIYKAVGFCNDFFSSEVKRRSTFLTPSAAVSVSGRMPRSNNVLRTELIQAVHLTKPK